ncbi:MAG: hypothetical protein JSW63_00015 [Ignavibacterium sp.]|nr:MAG: hypothetical protein JSW63_00015 [Ignavibacterium sp.]
MKTNQEGNVIKDDPPPPFFKTWKRLYSLVLGQLVLLIILFYIFTKVFE